MAKLTALPGMEIINGMKGTIDYYLHDGVACARKWPSSPGHFRTQAVMEHWDAFAFSASYWNSLSDEIKQAWITAASGYPITGRDLFTQAYINGSAITITPA